MDDAPSYLRRLIRLRLIESGLEVRELAEVLGVHRNKPARWASRGYIPEQRIDALAVALGLTTREVRTLRRLARERQQQEV